MPRKALVVFAVAFGFGLPLLSTPAWCSPAGAVSRPVGTAPETAEERAAGPTAHLLTLNEALMRALQRSPKLAAFTHEIRARELEALQAGLRPNPELSVEVENVAGSGEFSGTDSAETTVRISQLVELGGKRARRQEVGRLEQEMAEREYGIARAEVLAETRDRFISVLAAQGRVSLSGEQLLLAEKVLQTVEERIRAGKTAPIERVRFQTLISEARLRRETAGLELAAARRTLASAWGGEKVDFETVRGDLENVHAMPEWSELVSRLDQSPEAALRKSAIAKADRLVALERSGRIPDLTFSVGARNDQDTGDNALVAEVSIPLPIFDRNQGGVGAARARRAKAREAENDALLQLRTEVSDAWQKMHSARHEIGMLREEILPASRKTFEAVIYGYQAGKFGFLEVLDAERTLFETKSRYVDALATWHRAAADLERLLGPDLPSDENSAVYKDNERGQS